MKKRIRGNQRSLTRDIWNRLRRNTSAIVGFILFFIIAVACFVSPLFLDYDNDIIAAAWKTT